MTLVEHYLSEVAGMSSKEKEPIRMLWHAAARRYLILLNVTSDPPPEFKPDADGVTTVPVDMIGGCVWLSRPIDELVALYRKTKPTARGRRLSPLNVG